MLLKFNHLAATTSLCGLYLYCLVFVTIDALDFQVCKIARTWNCISLVINCLVFQVRTYSRTLEPVASLQSVLLMFRTSRYAKSPAPKTLFS